MSADDLPPKVRARLKLGQDPYAFIEFEDGASKAAPARSSAPPRRATEVRDRQQDLFATPPPIEHPATGCSGNPYARIPQVDGEHPVEHRPVPAASAQGVSKTEFRKRCAGIFQQYIPGLEGGRLRTYMRDFIDRNESKPASVRFLILQGLSKFDLSDLAGASPLFNREDNSLSEKKLRDIEQSAVENQ
jgi:hypothetical protein